MIISGIVQGVFFRSETCMRAQALGLTGWVMNRPDGNVEAIFEGDKDMVENIVRWYHKGPRGAVVDKVIVKNSSYVGEFKSFNVKYW